MTPYLIEKVICYSMKRTCDLKTKKIVFVKPTPNNIDDFYDSRYCKNKNVKYLLGRFIGHEKLADKIKSYSVK